ncbi:MAG: hypothetical protein KKB50_13530 [Planctomycetes bacterium]|nr:hypothetical protein [Planctomycetota bacterium]
MNVKVPKSVLDKRPGSLIVVPNECTVSLYIRESDWGLRNYPRQCPVDLRLPVWDYEGVLLVVLIVRLARQDISTFEWWINAAEPNELRLLQTLSTQERMDVFVVTNQVERSLRTVNSLCEQTAHVVRVVRTRKAWTRREFAHARERIDRLYPTSHALWWGSRDLKPVR